MIRIIRCSIRRGPHPGVLPTQLVDPGLDLRRGQMRAGARTVGAVREGGESSRLLAHDPGVDALAPDTEASRDLTHLPAVLALFHDAELLALVQRVVAMSDERRRALSTLLTAQP
jgi:hypothetical protein